MSDQTQFRRVRVPTTAARVCMLVGLILVVASLYYFFAPLDRTLVNGIIVHCGSPVRPSADADSLVACAALPGQELAKGEVLAAVGLVLLVFSTLVFGTRVRVDVAAQPVVGPGEAGSRSSGGA